VSRRYAPDEFDDVVPGDERRGAHRARPNRLLPVLPAALVAGVAGVVALSTVSLLGGGGDGATTDPGTAVVAAEQAPAAAVEAVPADLPADLPADPAAEVEVVSEPVAAPGEEAVEVDEADAESAEPDTSVPLVVLNGTKTTGLAARASTVLQREGWSVASTGNERGASVRATTVTYADDELAATAAAVADDLGAVAVEDADAESGTLTVVLGPDWTP